MGSTRRASGRLVIAASLLLGACAETELVAYTAKRIGGGDAAKPSRGVYKVGAPYQIDGTWYYPAVDYAYAETGIASWYGADFDGRATANGETYDLNRVTAAHRTLPLPSMVQVTNLENGRLIAARVNDRGPFKRGRIIDLSRRAAQLLGFERKGTAKVRVEILADESRRLAALAARRDGVSPEERRGVKAAPRIAVTSEALPLPGGSRSSSGQARRAGREPGKPTTPAAPKGDAMPATVDGTEAAEDVTVTVVPVKPTRMYIQAGAFAKYHNANRLRAILSSLGPTRVTAVMIGENQ
ncbi:MAG: septal ring lytic transglycosylase RlpA family protein, partial [Alphaproteobacteria bacterium]